MFVFRTADIVMIALMLAAAGFTYQVKHMAENRLDEVREIERQIQYEKDSIDVLRADWSLLTQPGRIQRLEEVYREQLELAPVEAHQIVRINELPARPLRIEDLTSEPLGGYAGGFTDGTTTGGVTR